MRGWLLAPRGKRSLQRNDGASEGEQPLPPPKPPLLPRLLLGTQLGAGVWQIRGSLKESITESHLGFSVGLGFFFFCFFLFFSFFYYRLSLWPVLWLERGVLLAGWVGRLAPRMIMCFPLLSVERDVLA